MKSSPIPSYDLEELRAILTKAGLIKRNAVLDLLPYQPAFARRTACRNGHYLVSSKHKAVCHLIVGKNLAPLHARARDFSTACPKLACPPLLYHQGSERTDYLCLEHFPGESLDVAVQNGRCSAADWLKTVRRAQEVLERTGQPSDPTRAQREIDILLKDACAFPGFSNVDAKLLLELAQPVLVEATASIPLVERWSTGDFVGRNLLVDAGGDVRLIDYDHAARTHFGHADWLRLMQFSVLPPGLDIPSIKELQFARRPGHEVYFWLHHLSLLRDAKPTDETKRHIASTVRNLFAAIDRVDSRKSSTHPRSYLIGSLLNRQLETEAALQERTAWAKSLDAELEKARAALAAQTALVEERSVWAKSLDQELRAARQNLEKLVADHAERSAWAKSLETDLRAAQGHVGNLTAEHTERTAWAKSLDAELQKARAELTVQSSLVEERSAWAKSLDAELAQSRTTLAVQVKLLDERTAWAKSLDVELQKARAELTAQSSLVEERSAWAKSLDAELQKARADLAAQSSLVKERSAWAKSLEAELQEARADLIAQSSLVEERSAWAKSLDAELQKARANLTAQSSLVDERSAWAKSLDAELQKARADLTAQSSLVEERSAWAKSLEQELRTTQGSLQKLTAEYAERSAWAKSLEADLQKARTAHQEQVQTVASLSLERDRQGAEIASLTQLNGELVARLSSIKHACAALAAMFPAWSKLDEVAILERCLQTLVDQQRELAAKNVAINAGAASTLRAQLDNEMADAEARRLTAALADAQLHVDGLLLRTAQLQKSIHLLHGTQRETENMLREKEDLLNSSVAELQTTRAELSRYETRLICRLAARRPSPQAVRKS